MWVPRCRSEAHAAPALFCDWDLLGKKCRLPLASLDPACLWRPCKWDIFSVDRKLLGIIIFLNYLYFLVSWFDFTLSFSPLFLTYNTTDCDKMSFWFLFFSQSELSFIVIWCVGKCWWIAKSPGLQTVPPSSFWELKAWQAVVKDGFPHDTDTTEQ